MEAPGFALSALLVGIDPKGNQTKERWRFAHQPEET